MRESNGWELILDSGMILIYRFRKESCRTMKHKCTILVNSCDAYEVLWKPFFFVLRDSWKNLDYKIILNTETKHFSMEGLDITTLSLGEENPDRQWGKRLLETLEQIDTEYVINLFDDFILEASVEQHRIEQCLEWMEKDQNIAVFYLMNIPQPNQNDNRFTGFDLVPQGQNYRLNSAPAIWRRKKLMEFTGEQDTPWAWEFFGSTRTYHTNDVFYCIDRDTQPIYQYANKLGGAIHRGKWVKSVIKPVVEKYHLDIDLEERGFEEENGALAGHSLKWKIDFFKLGYKMVGKDAWIMLRRMVKVKLKNRLRKKK